MDETHKSRQCAELTILSSSLAYGWEGGGDEFMPVGMRVSLLSLCVCEFDPAHWDSRHWYLTDDTHSSFEIVLARVAGCLLAGRGTPHLDSVW